MDLQRMLFDSPLPWLLPAGSSQGLAAVDLSLREPPPFPEGGDESLERTRVSAAVEIAGALGDRVEGSLRFGATRTGGPEDSDGVAPSDLRIRLGYAVRAGGEGRLPVAAWLLAKAPTGPDRGGVSTDEADLGAGLSAGGSWGSLDLFGHVGLELLGNPLRNGSQDDVAAYGAGGRLPLGSWSVTGEVRGRAFSRFDNSTSRLLLGAGWRRPSPSGSVLSAGVVFWHGLTDKTATWGTVTTLSIARF